MCWYLKPGRIKQKCKAAGKQCSKQFIETLDRKIDAMIETAITNARNFKRITNHDLI